MFCSQEKFASCFTKIKERNPDEFKSITEQLMQHLQNNIEVQLLWPRYNKFPPVVWHGRDVENVGTLGFVCYLRALDEVLQVPNPPPPKKGTKRSKCRHDAPSPGNTCLFFTSSEIHQLSSELPAIPPKLLLKSLWKISIREEEEEGWNGPLSFLKNPLLCILSFATVVIHKKRAICLASWTYV